MRGLDYLLFAGGWFAIDADNRRLPGVTPGALDEALSLVDRGWVASIVGKLRPEVRVVDVDLAGDRGLIAARSVTDWCRDRGLWHLVRASGGGRGRQHVFVVPGVHLEALQRHLDALRADLRASRTGIDLRERVRPLSAPHRRTGPTAAPDGAGAALTALQDVLQPVPDRILARRATSTAAPARAQGVREPQVPMARRRRSLPPAWAGYLARGRSAAATVDVDPQQRSLIEAQATFQLVICGYSEPQAWEAIERAHPTAFTKARERGRTWWWTVWNAAVRDADLWRRENRPQSDRAPLAATQHARAVVEASWRSWPASTRHRDLELVTVILDLMDQVQTTSLSIAQRELLLHCAVSSRGTVRSALRSLQAAGVVAVHDTFVPGSTDSSNTITLGPACEPPSQTDHGRAVSVNDPHAVTHPSPPLPLRTSLGLPASTLLRHLPDGPSPTGLPLPRLAALAGLTEPGEEPSARQLRTARAHLRALAEFGLASVDGDGHWRAVGESNSRRQTLVALGVAAGRRKHAQVQAERTSYRAVLDADQRRSRWAAQRARALSALPKAAVLAGRRQWWDNLPAHERALRERRGRDLYASLPPGDQAAYREIKARERAASGIDELAAYRRWEQETPDAMLEARSQEVAMWFHSLDPLRQAERLLHLRTFRERHGLPRYVPGRTALAQLPERELLRRLPPTDEDLVLFDAAGLRRSPHTKGTHDVRARTGT